MGGKVAVENLSFVVQPGTVTGFLGPNGARKSTTMRLILGLDAWSTQDPVTQFGDTVPLERDGTRSVRPSAG